MKLLKNILSWKFLVFIVLACAVYYLVFHFSIFPVARVKISRITSPDGKLDAVYVQAAAGTMSSGNSLVYIVPKGRVPKDKDKAVFHGKRTYDLAVSWEADRNLLIQYDKSEIKHFQSYIYPFPKYKVDIRHREK